MASAGHMKKVKGFLWKYGGGMDKVDNLRMTEADFAKVLLIYFTFIFLSQKYMLFATIPQFEASWSQLMFFLLVEIYII